jgi:AcrR family transcriptional regulator
MGNSMLVLMTSSLAETIRLVTLNHERSLVKTIRLVSYKCYGWSVTDLGANTSSPLASRRNESSRVAILEAALAVCREVGYSKLTIEAIAARAGVGKQTIYRWWPSKGAVMLEAFERVAAELSVADTGDVVDDVRTFVRRVVKLFTDPDFGPHLSALIGEAQHDPHVQSALLERYIKPRRAPLVLRLKAAQQNGQLNPSVDPDALLEVIFGALYHRLLLRNAPLETSYADFIIDVVFGTATQPEQRTGARSRRRAPSARPRAA